MVGIGRCGDADHPPQALREDFDLEYAGEVFSVEYAGRADLFDGLAIWKEEKYRSLQGTYPVLMVSFADVKENTFAQTRKAMCRILRFLYDKFSFLLEGDLLSESEKKDFRKISAEMEDNEASFSLKMLSLYLSRYYGKKVIILLDEYDTPMQEAYVNGYWEELVSFTRSMLEYLPIISAISLRLTLSRISLCAVISKQTILSSPRRVAAFIIPPLRCLRRCMQNDGAVNGFDFLSPSRCSLGLLALQDILSNLFCPILRTTRDISSFSGIFILSIFPPWTKAFISSTKAFNVI